MSQAYFSYGIQWFMDKVIDKYFPWNTVDMRNRMRELHSYFNKVSTTDAFKIAAQR